MGEFIKEVGKMIWGMEMDYKFIKIIANILEFIHLENLKDLVRFIGITINFIKDFGNKG